MAPSILSRPRRTAKPPADPRVYAYARVSTLEQSTNGVSLDEQVRRVAAQCMAENWTLTETFIERGVSGSLPLKDRPMGRQLLRVLEPGDVVLAAKLDRMFRSARDALDMIAEFKRRRIKAYCLDIGDISGNGVSALIVTVLAAVAEFERERICERIRDGKAQMRHEGKHQGGSRPFGFVLAPPSGRGKAPTLIPDPAEQAAIAEMQAMRDAGVSLMAVRDAMRAKGHQISHETIRRALRRAAEAGDGYDPAGKFSWTEDSGIEIVKPGTGEPLLSQEELDRIIATNRGRAG